jgi:hypothetical protein
MKLSVLFALLAVAELASAAELVTATASSSYTGREPIHAVNGSGLRDDAHNAELKSAWQGACWFRVDLGKVQPIRWMKLWSLNWDAYTDRGIRQADIYWSDAQDDPGNPVDQPDHWKLAVENRKFTRASHWPDYGRNPKRRMPDVVKLGDLRARYICLKIDSNFSESGRGYVGISEFKFSPDPFPKVEPIPDQDLDEPSLPLVANQRHLLR